MIHLDVRNISAVKRLYRRADLASLAARICRGEGVRGKVEVSLIFCDDPFIRDLNRQYRGKDEPTDVLAFQQEAVGRGGPRVLGDIVISLEAAHRFCGGNRAAMRDEARLLFCHGLLHLLGSTHAGRADKSAMLAKQVRYLGVEVEQAWHS